MSRVKKWDVDWDAPAALIAFAKLEADEIAVAMQITNLIYAQNGPIKNEPEEIKNYVKKMSRLRCEKVIHTLIHKGVIFEENGFLFSTKCQETLEKREVSFGKFSKAGKTSAEIRNQNKQNQGDMFNDVPDNVGNSTSFLPSTSQESKLQLPSYPSARDPVSLKDGSFKIMEVLTDDGRVAAKANAPGWDLAALAAKFDDNVKSGRLSKPRDPDAAFPAWCRTYTKGNRPK